MHGLGIGLLIAAAASPRGPAGGPFAACDAQVAAAPQDPESYRCYYAKTLKGEVPLAAAAARLESLLARQPDNAWIRLNLAHAELRRLADRTEGLYREAAEAFAMQGRADGEIQARVGLVSFFYRRGRLGEGDAQIERVNKVAEASGDRLLLARARMETARQLWRKGEDLGRAFRLAKEAESAAFPDGPYTLRFLTLHVLASISTDLGRHEDSITYHRRELDVIRAEGDHVAEATTLGNLAQGVLDKHERDGEAPTAETVALVREAVEAAVRAGNRFMEAGMRRELGDLLQGEEALEEYRRGLAVARNLGDVKSIGGCLRGLARRLAATDPEAAFRAIDEAFALGHGNGDRWDATRASMVRAHMRWETGPREQAVADSRATLDALEAIRDLQRDDEARAGLMSRWNSAYYTFAGRLLDPPSAASPDDLELAFQVTERLRARVLLEILDAAAATPALASRGPVASRRNAVLDRIAEVQRGLAKGGRDEAGRSTALRTLEALEREEVAFREELARENPGFAALRRPALPSLEQVRRALAEDEALLAFQVRRRFTPGSDVFEGGSWVWVVTGTGVSVQPLPDDYRLTPAIELFVGLFGRRDGSEAKPASRLYEDLLGEALASLPPHVKRLVLVPDGVLYQVPFAILGPAGGEPLATRYTVSHAPSVSLWLRGRQQRVAASDVPVLALADPEFVGAGKGVSADRAWALAEGLRMGRLPHAQSEGRLVVRTLGGASRLLLGAEATESFVKSESLTRYAILHVAAHALLDDQRPERSAVLLAPGSAAEDGLLQIREIVGLDLAGRVVVLSSCRSASGAVLGGEGPMGLARAFFQAGARTVVGSLWTLRDDEAEAAFRSFYRHVGDGLSVEEALAAAQRGRRRAGAPAAAWAGLVILGDGRAIPFPGGRPRASALAPMALALGFLGAVGTLFWLRRRRRS